MAVATKNAVRLKSATKKWGEMTKRERAVAVARDVLALIDLRKLTASHHYLRLKKNAGAIPDESDMRSLCLKTRKCSVCAKGALFVARTLGRNDVSAEDVGGMRTNVYDETDRDFYLSDPEAMCGTLSDAFTTSQLSQLEDAYEGCDWDQSWKQSYPNDEVRLKKLMQRIIDNKGTFTSRDMNNP